jgi:hypothetical protein
LSTRGTGPIGELSCIRAAEEVQRWIGISRRVRAHVVHIGVLANLIAVDAVPSTQREFARAEDIPCKTQTRGKAILRCHRCCTIAATRLHAAVGNLCRKISTCAWREECNRLPPILYSTQMSIIIQPNSQIQSQAGGDLPVVLKIRGNIEHHDALVEIMRDRLSRQIHNRSALMERPIDREVHRAEKVEEGTHKSVGEVVEILQTIDVDADMKRVLATDVGQAVLVDEVVLCP